MENMLAYEQSEPRVTFTMYQICLVLIWIMPSSPWSMLLSRCPVEICREMEVSAIRLTVRMLGRAAAHIDIGER